jgi:lipase ATG15
MRSIRHRQSEDIPWEEDEISGPDVESRETLLELAKMTHNAYIDPDDPAWYELDRNWTVVSSIFRWGPSYDYVYMPHEIFIL